MSAICFVIGTIFTIMSAFLRKSLFDEKVSVKKLLTFSSKDDPGKVLLATGQLMGVLWLLFGLLLLLIDKSYLSIRQKLVFEMIGVYGPMAIGLILLWLNKSSKRKL